MEEIVSTKFDLNNTRRLIRYLEIIKSIGKEKFLNIGSIYEFSLNCVCSFINITIKCKSYLNGLRAISSVG